MRALNKALVGVRSVSSMISIRCPNGVAEKFSEEFSGLPRGRGFQILRFPSEKVLEDNARRLLEKSESDAKAGCMQSRHFLLGLREYATDESSRPMLCSGAPIDTPEKAMYFTSLIATITGSTRYKSDNPSVRSAAMVSATNEEAMGYIDDSKKEIEPHTDQPGDGLERFALACIDSDSKARTYFMPHAAILEKLDPQTIKIGFEEIFIFNRDGKPAPILVKDLHGKDSVRNFDFDTRGFSIENANSAFSKEEIYAAVNDFRHAIIKSYEKGEYESVQLKSGEILFTLNGVHFRDSLEPIAVRDVLRLYLQDKNPSEVAVNKGFSFEEDRLSRSPTPTGSESLVTEASKPKERS